jgi:AcrR family transcriptional regulator
MKIEEISLRERKHAQTKLALLKAVIERLKENRLENISVKELCETIPISEVTFYNYFPQKTDLLIYFISLWNIEQSWHLQQWEQKLSNLEIIEAIFDLTARQVEGNLSVLSEALSFFVQKREKPVLKEISAAERLLSFPDLPGIENVLPKDIDRGETVFALYLKRAIELGELPAETDLQTTLALLDSIFIGSIMRLLGPVKDRIPVQSEISLRTLYRKQLQLIWSGLRA